MADQEGRHMAARPCANTSAIGEVSTTQQDEAYTDTPFRRIVVRVVKQIMIIFQSQVCAVASTRE
jgi:hypothetical protein